MSRKRILINSLLGIAIVSVGFGAYATAGTSASSTGTVTTTAKAATGIVMQTVSATGNVVAPLQTSVNFAQAGTITAILVKQGDVVTAGQPLAKVDDTTQLAALRVAQDSQAATQAAIGQTNAGMTADQVAQLNIATQQSEAGVTSANSSLGAAQASAAQDSASLQAAVSAARQSAANANGQLAVDQQTQAEDNAAYNAAQAASDPAKSGSESINETLIRYQNDQDACTAQRATTDQVECSGLSQLTRLLQAVSAQGKAVGASTNAVTQANLALQNAQRNEAASAVKDQQSVSGAAHGVENAKLSVQATKVGNSVKAAPPTPDVLAQQATQLAQAQTAVTTAQKAEDDTVLKAPIAGTITAINGSVGLSSSTGSNSSSGSGSSSASTAFATIVDLTQLQVKAGFAEADAARVTSGEAAAITFDALPTVNATAKVTTIDSLATVTSNVVTYTVTMTLDSVPAGVKPGMTSSAAVVAEHRDNVVMLPTSAVPTRGTSATLTVRDAKGKETQVAVTIGLRGDTTVEISSGLKAGDVVVSKTALSGGGSSVRGGTTGGG
ncbi:MAG: HlyD family efflux transporter periplasmic adaptor subunit, partial [Ilumatobacteraceae bacterium]